MLRVVFFVIVGCASASVMAEPFATFGEPIYNNGSGCRAGTASDSLSPDATGLSILFSRFDLNTDSRQLFKLKNCSIKIPVTVPNGYRIRAKNLDLRGYVSLTKKGHARTLFRYILTEKNRKNFGPVEVRNWKGPFSENIFNTPRSIATTKGCGGTYWLTIELEMQVFSSNRDEQIGTVDSLDISTDPQYSHFSLSACR